MRQLLLVERLRAEMTTDEAAFAECAQRGSDDEFLKRCWTNALTTLVQHGSKVRGGTVVRAPLSALLSCVAKTTTCKSQRCVCETALGA